MEWQLILALVIGIPIVVFVPALVWAAVVSGVYQVARETMRRRLAVPRRREPRMAEEPVIRQ